MCPTDHLHAGACGAGRGRRKRTYKCTGPVTAERDAEGEAEEEEEEEEKEEEAEEEEEEEEWKEEGEEQGACPPRQEVGGEVEARDAEVVEWQVASEGDGPNFSTATI